MGEVIPINSKKITLGRSDNCDIVLENPNVSSTHAEIKNVDQRLVLIDLKSTNGSFVNGVKVSKTYIDVGDKISFHDSLVEITSQGRNQGLSLVSDNSLAQSTDTDSQPIGLAVELSKKSDMAQKVDEKIESLVMPGIYKMGEVLDFKWLIAVFIVLVIVITTALASIPLFQILKSSIQAESQKRALTIAKTLAVLNRESLSQRNFSTLSIGSALQESGVREAYIVDSNGMVIAPAQKSGTTPDIPFIHWGRKQIERNHIVKQISSRYIGAMFPIRFFDNNEGITKTSYFSVVIYNMGDLSYNKSKVLSLFLQTLILALLAGFIIYFLLQRLISYPFRKLNFEMNQFLSGQGDQFENTLAFPELDKFYSGLKSALNRESFQNETQNFEYDRSFEMMNLVEIIGYPAAIIDFASQTFRASNPYFDDKVSVQLKGQKINEISDQSLKLSITDLLERATQQPDQPHVNTLDFSGIENEIIIQSIQGSEQVAYFIVVIIPIEGD